MLSYYKSKVLPSLWFLEKTFFVASVRASLASRLLSTFTGMIFCVAIGSLPVFLWFQKTSWIICGRQTSRTKRKHLSTALRVIPQPKKTWICVPLCKIYPYAWIKRKVRTALLILQCIYDESDAFFLYQHCLIFIPVQSRRLIVHIHDNLENLWRNYWFHYKWFYIRIECNSGQNSHKWL